MTSLDSGPASGADHLRDRYLDLLKGCLTRDLFDLQEHIDAVWWPDDAPLGHPEEVWEFLHPRGWRLTRPVDRARAGRDYIPAAAETMIGRARLDNVQELVGRVIRDAVPGDLVETGVWRGGTVILMKAVLASYGVSDRTVWVCDSFEGLPEPDAAGYPEDEAMRIDDADAKRMVDLGLAVTADGVRANFARYGLLDDQVRFLEGWFKDTLPNAPIDEVAVLRLDGDLYESTMDALVHLEPKVSSGGYVVVDDYGALEPCRVAVHDYRADHGISSPIHEVDWTGVYWQKGA